MTFNVLIFAHSLPGTSPEHFKRRYEEHITLVQEMTGEKFPQTHSRRYIARPRVQ
ncbi:hypothetical protein F4804DRAFT_315688 [Jackrogersella minutella]|nr:hypothetical protein F4804DRAFT_315688 [Jackrogersella minutella]